MKQPQPSPAPRAGITADQARAISALARTHKYEGAELTEKQFREMTSLQHQIGLTGYTVAELPLSALALGPNTVAYQLTDTAQSFQSDVATWMGQCFPPSLSSNMTERGDRLLEEVLELLQAHGYDSARVPTLVNYVFGRPVGEPAQEVGGVMVTLAAYCSVAGLSMQADGQAELDRINQPEVMARIRAKQEAKDALHFDTPLPGIAREPVGQPIMVEAVAEIFNHPESGLSIHWLLENGIGELQVGDVLMVSDQAITDEDGSGEVYAGPPAQAVDLGQFRVLAGKFDGMGDEEVGDAYSGPYYECARQLRALIDSQAVRK